MPHTVSFTTAVCRKALSMALASPQGMKKPPEAAAGWALIGAQGRNGLLDLECTWVALPTQ
ncbi:MAG: hypothetical protein AB7U18_28365, partial [Dehalococcoidia bacterium]